MRRDTSAAKLSTTHSASLSTTQSACVSTRRSACDATLTRLSPLLLALLASTCGLLAAALYFSQPLTALIGAELGLTRWAAGLLVTLTQLGYCAGLVLLTPLGDIIENKRLVVATMSASAIALVIVASASSAAAFLAASFLVGITACAVQMLVPLAAQMAPAHRRGRVIGTMTGGLLLGILLARPIASAVAGWVGWRAVFGASAVLTAASAVVLWRYLPTLRPAATASYAQLVASLWTVFARHRTLRKRALSQAALFGTFSLFWTTVPWLLLEQGYTQQAIALFALAGAGGALVAPIAGRLADRGQTRAVSVAAMLLVAAGFASTWRGGPMSLLVIAALAIDAGVQANHVVGQREVLALDAAVRNRLNSVYIGLFFFGGALASSAAGTLFRRGWNAVACAGALLAAAALAIYALYDRLERARALTGTRSAGA